MTSAKLCPPIGPLQRPDNLQMEMSGVVFFFFLSLKFLGSGKGHTVQYLHYILLRSAFHHRADGKTDTRLPAPPFVPSKVLSFFPSSAADACLGLVFFLVVGESLVGRRQGLCAVTLHDALPIFSPSFLFFSPFQTASCQKEKPTLHQQATPSSSIGRLFSSLPALPRVPSHR